MPARKIEVRVSRAADRDVENMALYTRRTWGEEQLLAYEATISQALETLSRHPHAGRPRDDLFLGCRSIPVEHHVVYDYQPDDANIVVRRILHGHQDASAKLKEPPA